MSSKRLSAFAFLCVLALPTVAWAQTSITILGLRSAAADEEVATNVTDALRQAAEAATSNNLSHTGRENALSQLLMLFDCTEPTPACVQEIGENLNSERLIFGLVEPETGRDDADYAVTLNFFNVETGQVERSLREIIPRNMTAEEMIEPVSRYYTALTGTVVPGELAIRCNVEGATVLLGDEEVGTTSAEPLVLRDLEPGERILAIEHDDYPRYEETVTIESGELTEVEVALGEDVDDDPDDDPDDDLDEDPDTIPPVGGDDERRSLAWLGWTNLGLAVVFGGLGIWNSVDVLSANNDEQLAANFSQGSEVCDGDARESSTGYSASEADDRCSRASTFQALQFVFYGLSAVTFGIGLWLVLREYLGRDDESEARLRLEPRATADGGASVNATLTF